MLQKDIRKAQTYKHIQRVLRRQADIKYTDWAACDNHGLTAIRGQLVGKTPETKPMEVMEPDKLVCHECKSEWHVHLALRHP